LDPGAAPVVDLSGCLVRAPTIFLRGPSPLWRVPDGGFGGSNLSESRSTCSGRGLVADGTEVFVVSAPLAALADPLVAATGAGLLGSRLTDVVLP